MFQTTSLLLLNATLETIYMVIIASLFATLTGVPLGIILFITRKGNILEQPVLQKTLTTFVNTLRSIPFIILMISIIPLTRKLVGTSIGTNAAIVPLALCAMPFVARIVENALLEISQGLIETATAMGATSWQIILKVLIPEALPGILNGLTLTIIMLIGYSAMAGAIGGGGLGDLAIRYGYQRFDVGITLWTIVIMIILVQSIQFVGDKTAKWVARRRH